MQGLHRNKPSLNQLESGMASERWEEGICAARGPGFFGLLRGQREKDGDLEMQGTGGGKGWARDRCSSSSPPSVYISCPLWTGEEVWRKSSVYLSVVLTLQILLSFETYFYFFVFLIFCDRLLALTLFIFSPIHKGNVWNNVPAALLHTMQVQKNIPYFLKNRSL